MGDKFATFALPDNIAVVRMFLDDDIAAITAIYEHHVVTGTGSFETVAPSSDEIRTRLAHLQEADYPVVVAVAPDNRVIGYGYAGPHKTRAAYKHTVEDSVYVHPDHVGLGIGKALLCALIKEAQLRGYKQMMAVIGDSGNLGSIKLHKALGFTHIGIAQKVGFKFNRMIDVVYMQRDLEPTDI